jgi:hypothetical protein
MESGGEQGTHVGARTTTYRIVIGGELSERYAMRRDPYFERRTV